MYLLIQWYLKMCWTGEARFVMGRTRQENYLGYDELYAEFSELHQLLNKEALDKSLLGSWCL
jgi:hypothetical protein